ncbi:hypothetical protein CCR94_15975 [Rhodoblastus sphagnicola]|uniref:Uncharacterized protein n=1 Tax=Rhodoblastus sphagnicola TaxID=333368 RepID=A0A2S6N3C8_9HYPH|nr:hypothetical protein [Rhodoblastus sphagnicola]MBB4201182.1 hypothetical protein [Rhodoblastus sphagnicola]PPQ29102.1 hypothetical protein CCR94_15975 [Rhodoblastus sphagnicola]
MGKAVTDTKLQLYIRNSLKSIEFARRRMDYIVASTMSSAEISDQIDMCDVLLSEISAVTESIGCLFTNVEPECSRLTRNVDGRIDFDAGMRLRKVAPSEPSAIFSAQTKTIRRVSPTARRPPHH